MEVRLRWIIGMVLGLLVFGAVLITMPYRASLKIARERAATLIRMRPLVLAMCQYREVSDGQFPPPRRWGSTLIKVGLCTRDSFIHDGEYRYAINPHPNDDYPTFVECHAQGLDEVIGPHTRYCADAGGVVGVMKAEHADFMLQEDLQLHFARERSPWMIGARSGSN